MRTITTAGDAEAQTGMARARLARHQVDGARAFLQLRRRDADRGAAEQAALPHRVRRHRDRARRDCVIPRGVIFRVELINGPARAYMCENYGGAFALPDRGPIGANCLANPRDFYTPVAAYEDSREAVTLYRQMGRQALSHQGAAFAARRRGLARQLLSLQIRPAAFFAGRRDALRPSRSVDLHGADAPSETPGTANVDFVIFPERWAVAENTFRPPWYHRNIMSEFMGLVYGVYDAKPEGFVPGGMSLHNQMLPHGPDEESFKRRARPNSSRSS